MKADRFTRFAQYLRAKVPVKCKVIIKRVAMHDDGNTSVSGDTITVTIRKSDPVSAQIDTLIHEWGHVREFDSWKAHGEVWGKGMSLAYQAWEQFTSEGH